MAKCRSERYGGYIFCMLLFLIVGYIYFVFYAVFIGLYVYIKLSRYQATR